MKTKHFLYLALPLAYGLLLASCSSEPQNIDILLPGRWELDEAKRDGQPAESLTGLYYEFDENGQMRSNLPVGAGESQYELDGATLMQKLEGKAIDYTIESINDSVLVMLTELRGTNFWFKLKRAMNEE